MSTVGVISLGCSKNRVDSERILGCFADAGFTITQKPEEAEVLLVNTCGFITPAKEESINTTLEMAQYKENGHCRLLVMTGCLSQRYREELETEMPEVDLFWGVHEPEQLVRRVCTMLGIPADCAMCGRRILTTPGYSAYLRIADGCDNRCTYCAIPLIRGGRKSVPMESLLTEARSLAENGVKELTLIAQDTSAYGTELYGKPMLAELLRALCQIDGFQWIRVLYAYPNTVTEELIDMMLSNDKIVKYIDMPIQHIAPRLLKDMNRHGTREHIEHMVDYIRKASDEFILRTTVMLGFPGESEDEFGQLAEFLQAHPFDRVGAFTFSPEDGTPAALMKGQLEEEVKQRRLDAIMKAQQHTSLILNQKRIGRVENVLVEQVSGGTAYGRSYAEAPDVDGMIAVSGVKDAGLLPGMFIKTKLTQADAYDLKGEMLQ